MIFSSTPAGLLQRVQQMFHFSCCWQNIPTPGPSRFYTFPVSCRKDQEPSIFQSLPCLWITWATSLNVILSSSRGWGGFWDSGLSNKLPGFWCCWSGISLRSKALHISQLYSPSSWEVLGQWFAWLAFSHPPGTSSHPTFWEKHLPK